MLRLALRPLKACNAYGPRPMWEQEWRGARPFYSEDVQTMQKNKSVESLLRMRKVVGGGCYFFLANTS